MLKKTICAAVIAVSLSSTAMASGVYVGAGLGALNLRGKLTDTFTYKNDGESHKDTYRGNNTGVNGTVMVGYAWDTPKAFFGLELFDNLNSARISKNLNSTTNEKATLTVRNTYGLRVLPGVHLTPETVGYGILGVARSSLKLGDSSDEGSGHQNLTVNGYQVGLGSMTHLDKNIALRGDVIYTGYRNKTVFSDTDSLGNFTEKLKVSTMEANLSLVYTFG